MTTYLLYSQTILVVVYKCKAELNNHNLFSTTGPGYVIGVVGFSLILLVLLFLTACLIFIVLRCLHIELMNRLHG